MHSPSFVATSTIGTNFPSSVRTKLWISTLALRRPWIELPDYTSSHTEYVIDAVDATLDLAPACSDLDEP